MSLIVMLLMCFVPVYVSEVDDTRPATQPLSQLRCRRRTHLARDAVGLDTGGQSAHAPLAPADEDDDAHRVAENRSLLGAECGAEVASTWTDQWTRIRARQRGCRKRSGCPPVIYAIEMSVYVSVCRGGCSVRNVYRF